MGNRPTRHPPTPRGGNAPGVHILAAWPDHAYEHVHKLRALGNNPRDVARILGITPEMVMAANLDMQRMLEVVGMGARRDLIRTPTIDRVIAKAKAAAERGGSPHKRQLYLPGSEVYNATFGIQEGAE